MVKSNVELNVRLKNKVMLKDYISLLPKIKGVEYSKIYKLNVIELKDPWLGTTEKGFYAIRLITPKNEKDIIVVLRVIPKQPNLDFQPYNYDSKLLRKTFECVQEITSANDLDKIIRFLNSIIDNEYKKRLPTANEEN